MSLTSTLRNSHIRLGHYVDLLDTSKCDESFHDRTMGLVVAHNTDNAQFLVEVVGATNGTNGYTADNVKWLDGYSPSTGKNNRAWFAAVDLSGLDDEELVEEQEEEPIASYDQDLPHTLGLGLIVHIKPKADCPKDFIDTDGVIVAHKRLDADDWLYLVEVKGVKSGHSGTYTRGAEWRSPKTRDSKENNRWWFLRCEIKPF